MVAVIVHLPRRRLGQSWSVVLNWRNLARGYKLVACARDWPQPVGQLTHGPFKPISSATVYLASLISDRRHLAPVLSLPVVIVRPPALNTRQPSAAKFA